MKKIISIMCLGLMLAGCQQAPQEQNAVNNDRQDASKKFFAQSMTLLQQKDIKGAVEDLEAAMKADPSDPNAYLALGQILLKSEQYAHAVEFLDQTAKTFPNNGTVFYMLSIANKMAGNRLPAVLAARRSYEIFNAASDTAAAQTSAILLEQLIKEAQAEESSTVLKQDKGQAAASSGQADKAGAAVKK